MRKDLKPIYEANLRDFGHLTDEEIMALTIYAEARGEILAGKIAVGTVIMNRVRNRSWDGRTVRDVCLWPKQFSCFNPDDKQRAMLINFANNLNAFNENKELRDCYIIAIGLIKGSIRPDKDLVKSKCCQYLTAEAKKNVDWWKTMKFVKKIGNHEFYTDLI